MACSSLGAALGAALLPLLLLLLLLVGVVELLLLQLLLHLQRLLLLRRALPRWRLLNRVVLPLPLPLRLRLVLTHAVVVVHRCRVVLRHQRMQPREPLWSPPLRRHRADGRGGLAQDGDARLRARRSERNRTP